MSHFVVPGLGEGCMRTMARATMVAPIHTVPFVGRASELDELAGAIGDLLTAGRGSIVVVSGEAGIGKSRFLAEAMARLPDADVRLFAAAAQELDRLRPFGVVADGLEVRTATSAQARAVAVLLSGDVAPGDASPMTLAFSPWRRGAPPLGVVAEASHLQLRILERIGDLVESLCQESPVVLVVDDVQWADLSSLLVLHRVAQATARLPLVLVCSHRPYGSDTDLGRLLAGFPPDRTRTVRLGPLSDDEVDALVAAAVEGDRAPALGRRVARAAGNPFFVLELVHSGPPDGGDHGDEVPRSVADAVSRRLGALPRSLHELLQVAAVLGSTFTATDLAVVVGRPVSELAGVLGDGLAYEVLSERDGVLGFRHDLLRESLYVALPQSFRKGLHLQAARALAGSHGRVDVVAEHLLRGADPGDSDAVASLHLAARQAGPRAPAISLKLLRRALELADPNDPSVDRIIADEVAILNWAGEASEVEAIARDLLGRVHDPSTEPLVRLCLAQSLLGRGRLAEALVELRVAVDSAALSDAQRARFRAWASKCLMLLGDMHEAARVAEVAVAEAEAAGDVFARCLGGAVLALMTNFAGEFRPALALADRVISIADTDPTEDAHRFPLHLYRAAILLDLDEFEPARESVARGRRISAQLGTAWNLPMYHLISAVGLFWSGDWDDAIAEFEAGRELADEIGGRIGMVAAFGLRSMIALHRGDLRQAEEHAALGERELAATGPQYRADWLLWARALLLEGAGDVTGGLAVLRAAWDGCAAAGVPAEFPILGPDLVRMAIAAGDPDTATEVAARVDTVATADLSSLHAAAVRCRALVTGRPDDFRASSAAAGGSSRKLDRAVAWEEAGRALLATEPDEGRRLLDEALAVYDFLGCTPSVARIEAGLRSLGVRRGRRGVRKRPTTGWDALTPTEMSVARLVSGGLSNAEIAERLFISPRTARTHVSHCLLKLGFRSRSELAAELVRRGG